MGIRNEIISQLLKGPVAIVGLGRSNLPLLSYLLTHKLIQRVDVYDAKTTVELLTDEQLALLSIQPNVKLFLGQRLTPLQSNYTCIIRTPGMRPDHPIFLPAIKAGAVVTSEIEIFMALCPALIIGVTGSDGKSTTSTLIFRLLLAQGYQAFLGGNIGNSLVSELDVLVPESVVVLELSSFQLIGLRLSPDISVITNLSPNHLDVHVSIEEYYESKLNIIKQPNFRLEHKKVVINADDLVIESMRISGLLSKTDTLTAFSRRQPLSEGLYILEDDIVLGHKDTLGITNKKTLLKVSSIRLTGNHNIENYLAAIMAVSDLVEIQAIASVAGTFQGVEHRLEYVKEVDGVKYYNDSIASSPNRTMAGLNSFSQKLILIAGGAEKGLAYDTLAEGIVKHAKLLILLGSNAAKIQNAVEKIDPTHRMTIHRVDSLREAVDTAYSCSTQGDVVLLSPASTSFDMFRDFAHRGMLFKEYVRNL